MKIVHVSQLSGTPWMALAVEAQHELMKYGLADHELLNLNWDDSAVVATSNHDEPWGLITYAKTQWKSELVVKLGYVRFQHRSNGVYRRLWSHLVEVARGEKLARIYGVVKVDNGPMRAVMRRLGRVEESVNYVYEVL